MINHVYQNIAARIIELMEKGTCPWRQPWSTRLLEPKNFASGHTYRGINHMILNASGFESPYFMTFHQVLKSGGAVKQGSKGMPVVYWKRLGEEVLNSDETQQKPRDESMRGKQILRMYTVFNAAQIDGIDFPSLPKVDLNEFRPIERAEEIVDGWKDSPPVVHGKHRACYIPLLDVIELPSREAFHTPAEYYATRFHEMGHATGAQHRLGRNFEGRFGSSKYAKEELVAEMTAAFLCSKCGIDNHVVENQAAYMNGWIQKIKEEPNIVVTAASQGQKAANLILNLPERQLVVPERIREQSDLEPPFA